MGCAEVIGSGRALGSPQFWKEFADSGDPVRGRTWPDGCLAFMGSAAWWGPSHLPELLGAPWQLSAGGLPSPSGPWQFCLLCPASKGCSAG